VTVKGVQEGSKLDSMNFPLGQSEHSTSEVEVPARSFIPGSHFNPVV
jgi:hypothetical protein